LGEAALDWELIEFHLGQVTATHSTIDASGPSPGKEFRFFLGFSCLCFRRRQFRLDVTSQHCPGKAESFFQLISVSGWQPLSAPPVNASGVGGDVIVVQNLVYS
jgi:hypothetical protein